MILLLIGSSGVARTTIAEGVLKKFPSWRHLDIDDIANLHESGEQGREDGPTLLSIICHCADEMQQDGYDMILTLSVNAALLAELRENLSGGFLTVHLATPGESDGETYDYIVDSSTSSLQETLKFLCEVIEENTPEDSPQ